MSGPEPHHPKVFISYSHDSLEHSNRVRELSDRLRFDGVDCDLDQYEISPLEGWPLWMDKQIRDANFVLMVCTETYYRRVMGEEKPGIGLGVRWEGHLIYQHLSNAATLNTKFVPLLFESGQFEHIPTPLQGFAYYRVDTDEGYEDLYGRLTHQPRHLKPALGDVRKLRPIEAKARKQEFFAAQLTNLPFARNPFFTGREQILKALHSAFTEGGATQAISGLGGLGKTQIAIEYAYQHRDDYKAVFWVRADSHLGLNTGFAEIARVLNLPEKDAQNPGDTVRAVNQWLESNSGWLLIFDNADTPDLLKAFCPRHAKGHIVLTSRAQTFASLGIAKPLEVETMSPEEALRFLFTRTGRNDHKDAEREAAAQIAQELGYLPLALEQAGTFMTAKSARFRDYLADFRKRHLDLLKISKPFTGDYSESVSTTWAINFREVEKVSQAASDLLRASAFIGPDRIPLELIINGKSKLGDAVARALSDVDGNPLALNTILEPLTRYSFIRLDNDSQTYSIHRLVQEVLRDGMDADTQRFWAERSVRALNQTFPEVEFSTWPLCERLLPHTKVAAKSIEKWDITTEEAARLLNQAAYFCYEQGQYADAEPLYKRSRAIRERILGPDHPDVARSLNNLALLYRAQGKYTGAERLFRQSLRIREKALGPDHPQVAQSLSNLAEVYRIQGKYVEAEPLLIQSLTIKKREANPNPASLAWSLDFLALVHIAQGKYDEAETIQRQSLEIREREFGPDDPNVASSLNNLAELYRLRGRHAEAESLCMRSLQIREKTLGPDHDDVAQSLNTLAALYRDRGQFAEAEPLYERSLAIFERALGPEHPDVALTLQNYSALLRALQRDAEAKKIEARAATIQTLSARNDSIE